MYKAAYKMTWIDLMRLSMPINNKEQKTHWTDTKTKDYSSIVKLKYLKNNLINTFKGNKTFEENVFFLW